MGAGDSKLINRKLNNRRIIKCPIETTEIIASDCGSIYHRVDHCELTSLSLSDFNDHDIHPVESLSNLSLNKTDWSENNSVIIPQNYQIAEVDTNDNKLEENLNVEQNLNTSNEKPNSNRNPTIQKLNSKIELLNDNLSDGDITDDEFTTSKESESDSSSGLNSSLENDEEENNEDGDDKSSSSDFESESESSDSISTKLIDDNDEVNSNAISFNKNFIKTLKNRYNFNSSGSFILNKPQLDNQNTVKSINSSGDDSINVRKNYDLDDSFTEITKVLPSNGKISKNEEVRYLQNLILNKFNDASLTSLENTSCKTCNVLCNNSQNSKIEYSNISAGNLKRNIHSSLDNQNHIMTQPGFRCLCYKFWVDATFDTWKVFHNPRDRRIESIGRLSNCQIRLTKITQRSTKGMLKRQVFVYSSTLSALKKCCKLFDDKFPQFCASAGLTIDNVTTK